jgi:iron complex transport system substrate-binding protein
MSWFKPLSAALLAVLSFNISAQSTAQTKPAAQRIISLAPSLTELAYSAGAGDKLVGVVSFSDYPPAALQLANVGSYNALNLERIIELSPDLILAWRSGNPSASLQHLEKTGIQLLIRDSQTLAEIADIIEEIGERAGTPKPARVEAQRLRDKLTQLRQANQGKARVRVFYQVWNQPLITLGGPQFISEALAVCGADNVFAKLDTLAPHVSLEAVIAENPDAILLGGLGEVQQQWLTDWQQVTHLPAIQNRQIYPLNTDHYQRPTARLIDALPELCAIIDQIRALSR